MKATRTFLVVITAAAVAGACSRTPTLVAPPDGPARSGTLQTTSNGDTVSTEPRGVYTLGSGN